MGGDPTLDLDWKVERKKVNKNNKFPLSTSGYNRDH